MIPKDQKRAEITAMGDLDEAVPLLNLGKKLSVPQDLMMEELSLRNNRGSLLFQKRQQRVQRFTYEFSDSQQAMVARSNEEQVTGAADSRNVANGPGRQNYSSQLQVLAAPAGDPEHAPAASAEGRARGPSALAPGYAEPLRDVPPEKFNHTAIPKGYRCPWQELGSSPDYRVDSGCHTPSLTEYRNFNKTPVPFGGLLVEDPSARAGTLFLPELTSGLDLLRLRPNFNRVAQGWVRQLPESEEL
ncbi:myozenin-3 isoform X1 [Erinaceus europaeus]|uniref:Myozenin-3 isoform X1 n=1 Tax=Erinaceus europaeus TaxID=9365 RepID=A0A1S2ZAP4_ERIEU|nr:myozenin-3 isoform X1 [Erinaceus europaeus]